MDIESVLSLIPLQIASISLFAFSYYKIRQANEKLSWPVTTGEVIHAKLTHNLFANRWQLDVSYRFTIYRTLHVGYQKGYANSQYKSKVRQVLKDLPKIQTIHYNPTDPEQSGLEQALQNIVKRNRWYMLLCFLMFTLSMFNFILMAIYPI